MARGRGRGSSDRGKRKQHHDTSSRSGGGSIPSESRGAHGPVVREAFCFNIVATRINPEVDHYDDETEPDQHRREEEQLRQHKQRQEQREARRLAEAVGMDSIDREIEEQEAAGRYLHLFDNQPLLRQLTTFDPRNQAVFPLEQPYDGVTQWINHKTFGRGKDPCHRRSPRYFYQFARRIFGSNDKDDDGGEVEFQTGTRPKAAAAGVGSKAAAADGGGGKAASKGRGKKRQKEAGSRGVDMSVGRPLIAQSVIETFGPDFAAINHGSIRPSPIEREAEEEDPLFEDADQETPPTPHNRSANDSGIAGSADITIGGLKHETPGFLQVLNDGSSWTTSAGPPSSLAPPPAPQLPDSSGDKAAAAAATAIATNGDPSTSGAVAAETSVGLDAIGDGLMLANHPVRVTRARLDHRQQHPMEGQSAPPPSKSVAADGSPARGRGRGRGKGSKTKWSTLKA